MPHLGWCGYTRSAAENDTVAVEEFKFGDNDNLSALTGSLVEADLLVILSDVDGLHETDPRRDPAAPLVPLARAADPRVARIAGPARSDTGTGGMASKVAAGRWAQQPWESQPPKSDVPPGADARR